MSNYVLTSKVVEAKSVDAALDAAEVYIETVDSTKTILLCQLVQEASIYKVAILHIT